MSTEDREQQKRRSLGCAVWAILLAAISTTASFFIVHVVHDWATSTEVRLYKDFIGIYLGWLLIIIAVFSPIAAVIGWRTKNPINRNKVITTSIIIVVITYTVAIGFLLKLCELGDTGKCVPISDSPLTILFTALVGSAIGVIAGLGYWKAGRGSGKKERGSGRS